MTGAFPRLLLAAPRSGSGKTTITCGLLTALVERGMSCQSFKCGPDYIDPMFHQWVLGVKGGNLDTYFSGMEGTKRHFAQMAQDAQISVIEGVMGYYDGIGGDTFQASTYEVAQATDSPVVLVLDCKGASLSIGAVAKGFLEYREKSHIKGVILNRISPVMAKRLKPKLEAEGMAVYGYLPECQEARFDSRHLGLRLPSEVEGLKEQLLLLAGQMEKTVDIDGLLLLAGQAARLEAGSQETGLWLSQGRQGASKVRIAYGLDPAFCFYYQENLRLLEAFGADLIPFSPLSDENLPESADGLLLGGGYPELYARELSENARMRSQIRKQVEGGLPTLAECGGFLYLHQELEGADGISYPMAGVIQARAYGTKKLSRFGYVELSPHGKGGYLRPGEWIRGHEFHYWDSTDPGSQMTAQKPGGRASWECIHQSGSLMAGFPHLYYPSNPLVARRFVNQCRKRRR